MRGGRGEVFLDADASDGALGRLGQTHVPEVMLQALGDLEGLFEFGDAFLQVVVVD